MVRHLLDDDIGDECDGDDGGFGTGEEKGFVSFCFFFSLTFVLCRFGNFSVLPLSAVCVRACVLCFLVLSRMLISCCGCTSRRHSSSNSTTSCNRNNSRGRRRRPHGRRRREGRRRRRCHRRRPIVDTVVVVGAAPLLL